MKIILQIGPSGNKFWGVIHKANGESHCRRHRYGNHPAVLLSSGYLGWYEYGVKTGDNRDY
jgi:hypothetical protein